MTPAVLQKKVAAQIIALKKKIMIFDRVTYSMETHQFLAAIPDATLNKDKPIIDTAGAIVKGVINFNTRPTIPEIWKQKGNTIILPATFHG